VDCDRPRSLRMNYAVTSALPSQEKVQQPDVWSHQQPNKRDKRCGRNGRISSIIALPIARRLTTEEV
jgi:hypothetical protein